MSANAVPAVDIDSLFGFIRTYGKEDYAEKNLQGDWKSAKTLEYIYSYPDAIDTYLESPFDDLSCREAAFIVFNSFLNTPDYSTEDIETEGESPLFPSLAILKLEREPAYYTCYEALLSSFSSEKPVAEAVKSYWEEQNIEFEGNDIHFVSFWGKEDGKVINLHCGVLFEGENNIYFFEKIDPIMPYQISAFSSTEDMKEYLLNRTEGYEDRTVFIDNEAI